MSTMLYKATLGLGKLTSCADRTLKEAWLYATGLKRLENRYGLILLPKEVDVTAGLGLFGSVAAVDIGGVLLLMGAGAGSTEMVNSGIEFLVYGGGGSLAASLGVLNAYSHWKAGQHDYRLERKEQCMALTGPSAQRPLLLK